MHRFFVAPEMIGEAAVGDYVRVVGAVARQIAVVLRLRPNERIALLADTGWIVEVALTEVTSAAVIGRVERRALAGGEPRLKITLWQGLPKADKFEFVLQKGVEIGVAAFAPMATQRSVATNLAAAQGPKLDRWRRIIVEAAEQSGRGRLPTLAPIVLFSQACASVSGLSLIADPDPAHRGLRAIVADHFEQSGQPPPLSVNVMIGPEGGFDPAEIEIARGYGIVPIGLGPRVLRTETAGLAIATALLWASGDFGSSARVTP